MILRGQAEARRAEAEAASAVAVQRDAEQKRHDALVQQISDGERAVQRQADAAAAAPDPIRVAVPTAPPRLSVPSPLFGVSRPSTVVPPRQAVEDAADPMSHFLSSTSPAIGPQGDRKPPTRTSLNVT